MNPNNTGCKASVRQSVANELQAMAEDISKMAMETAGRVNDKLSPIVNNNEETTKDLCTPEAVWPVLFSQLRGSLSCIRASLSDINKTMNRVEL